ncbi:hypothetical protein BJY01DRAFT_255954 [Aspergillus pseudoustus]|uniref:Major facilitator superfamily (MFS) profile domain-containing protein n=1 Tax=Aspergillus pseudoustus TaxID=1810923 RepID=A0ABR4IFM4_9EURO
MPCMAITSSFGMANRSAGGTSSFLVFPYNFFFPIGLLRPIFLYCTDVASTRRRVAMTSISTANHRLWNFLVQMVTPYALSSIGSNYCVVYAIIGLTYILSVYFFYPETMGQSLENLEDVFQRDMVANKLSRLVLDEEIPAEEIKGETERIEKVL